MKKKIVTACLVVALLVVGIVGASLAYFTDKDAKDNVFTTGKVDISLDENFEPNSKLLPATGSAQAGTLENGVTKEIAVKAETGSEDTYVRVHIAIPSVLDDGASTFDAKNNVLHFNYDKDSIGQGKWDWSKTAGAPYEGDWNYYETTPEYAMHQVYLDSKVTNADITKIKETLGDNWEIKVIAEGAQAAGFDNAYAALNTAFGAPGTYNAFAK